MNAIWGRAWVGLLMVVLLGASGCNDKEKAKLIEEIDHLNQVNMNYEKEVRELMAQLESNRLGLLEKEADVEGLRRQIEVLEQRLREAPNRQALPEKMQRMLRAIAEEVDGELIGNRIILPGSFLFPSGSWALKSSAQRALKQIAVVLSPEDQKLVLMIVGHTDNEPIKKLKRKGITSNRQLSLMRSLSVLNYMERFCKYPGDLMYPTGWGELKPVASNANEAGRARNRRVEIWVDPILSNLTPISAISGVGPVGMDAGPLSVPAPAGGDAGEIKVRTPETAVFEK